ncbi:ABC transporter ATP-binding protein, partial [Patescibacteria group bacterium]
SIFAILALGLALSVQDLLSIGQFILLLGFVSEFYPDLWSLMMGFRDIAKNYEDITRYYGLLNNLVEIKDPKNPVSLENIDGEIRFDKVSFSYKEGSRKAVDRIDLTIRQGQSIALVGRSGSGKTTLTKLLMRFYDVGGGEITIDRVNVKDMAKSTLRSYMGVVPQEPIMFNNTVAYNIGYGKATATRKEIRAAAKMANLHAFIETLSKKYNTNVGERGVKLSGGQKQRLAIARMILSDPEIIVFDEATSQLDSENERKIQDAFWKVSANKTTIIIAHRLSTAMRADKIVVMNKGKITESGSHKTLLANPESLYKKFWDLQTNVD